MDLSLSHWMKLNKRHAEFELCHYRPLPADDPRRFAYPAWNVDTGLSALDDEKALAILSDKVGEITRIIDDEMAKNPPPDREQKPAKYDMQFLSTSLLSFEFRFPEALLDRLGTEASQKIIGHLMEIRDAAEKIHVAREQKTEVGTAAVLSNTKPQSSKSGFAECAKALAGHVIAEARALGSDRAWRTNANREPRSPNQHKSATFRGIKNLLIRAHILTPREP